jgi:hypothetical protein
MKISFPKYGGELLTRKRFAPWIIAFVAIGLVAGVCGSFFVGNKLWLLAIAVLGIAGIVLCIGVAVASFPTQSQVNEAPSAPIEENMPESISRWDYRPRKPIRARGVLDSPSTETSDSLSSDSFEVNNNVWLNDNSLEGAAPIFIDGPPETEEPITKPLPQTNDSSRTGLAGDDAALSTYD